MEIVKDSLNGAPMLRPAGKIDTTTAAEFEAAIADVLGDQPKLLAIDFTGVSYISSAGLRVMLMAAKKMKPVAGTIALFGMSDQIREVFQISGFAAMFTIATTEETAAAALKG